MARRRLTVALAGGATLAVGLGVGLAVGLSLERQPPRRQERPPIATVQPPPRIRPLDPRPAPARWEERFATELLLAHPVLGETIRGEYAKAAGRRLRSPGELRVHTLIFRRHGCETHRCLQVFIRFPGGVWLDVGRVVVDLTTENVRVLEW
ncbi:hypothetical protein ABGB17_05630 [Sphaerisporangium sp. B11E5]|uniref:hypothetical protein n=1 Tax=Sphaerisporangium sp. B11E5 TaxID=3153563 RepID=UPI00325DEBA8